MNAQAVVGGSFIVAGTLLIAVGALGLLRLPDVYNRTNAVTKAAGLGIVFLMIGVLTIAPGPAAFVTLGLAIVLQLFTVPIAGFAIGHAAYRSDAPPTPSTQRDEPPGGAEDR
jgi:multicomponent Na+:H+ antiporter subunit G